MNARALVVAVLACCAVAACDDAPQPKPDADATSGATAKPRSNLAVLPANMVAAVSAGKTASKISVHFALEALPTVGKSLPVSIAVVSHQPFTSVHATFESPETIAMVTGQNLDAVKDVKAEAVLSHKLLLQPRQEGVFLVTAAVETEGDEGTVTRIYSIPLIVHGADTAPKAAAPAAQSAPAG